MGGGKGTVSLWEVASGKKVQQFQRPGSRGVQDFLRGQGIPVVAADEEETPNTLTALAFSPDGRSLAGAGTDDFTVLVWDVTGRFQEGKLPGSPLTAKELASRWGELAEENAATAYRAVWRLVRASDQAVSFLRKQLRPVAAVDTKRLRQLVADLGDKRYIVRHKATRELEELGDRAEASLVAVLRNKPGLEVHHRAAKLLEGIERERRFPSGERLRLLRALGVLEQIGSPQALQVLKTLAAGAPASWQTKAVQAACERLAKKPRGQ
jgi:hypothetical protein